MTFYCTLANIVKLVKNNILIPLVKVISLNNRHVIFLNELKLVVVPLFKRYISDDRLAIDQYRFACLLKNPWKTDKKLNLFRTTVHFVLLADNQSAHEGEQPSQILKTTRGLITTNIAQAEEFADLFVSAFTPNAPCSDFWKLLHQ